MRALIRTLWGSTAFWRYVDAFSPRVFGLIIHTLLVWRYGTAAYALPTWCLGFLGLALGFIPDPHALIIVRRSGAAARRLLALTMPWVVLKLATAATICALATTLVSADTLLGPHGTVAPVVVGTALLFGSVETAWAVVGTAALAVGNVRAVALRGLLARTISLLLLAGGALLGVHQIWADLAVAAVPALVALATLAPFSTRISRSTRFMVFATRHYGIWAQGLALLSGWMLQAPVLVLGALPAASAAGVGQLSFVTRVIGAALQPFQILQSLAVREIAMAKGPNSARLTRLRNIIRSGAVLIAGAGLAAVLYVQRETPLAPGVAPLAMVLVIGIAFSAWHRFELSSVLATRRIRELFLLGYLPVLVGATAVGGALMPLVGMPGLGVSMAIGWIGTALSWKWIRT